MFQTAAIFLIAVLAAVVFPAKASGEMLENVEYGKAGDYSLRLDASIPGGSGPFPAAIIVHGGAWVAGDRKLSVEPLFRPLSDAGFAWFSISYRLPNQLAANALIASLLDGSQVEDVRQAVAYVKGHAAEYHVDANRIALIGESAGGQLASMAALQPGPGGNVRAVVAFYSPSDLGALARNSTLIPDSLREAVRNTSLDGFLMAGLADISPVNFVRRDSPPFLMIHGTADRLVPFDQSKQMCDKMLAAGAPCELYPVEGAGHGMRWWESSRITAYKARMIAWLDQVMSRSEKN